MEGSTLFEWADRLKALRDRKEALEAELKQVNVDIDDADWHLSNLMAESETQNFTRAGTMFCLTTKTRANAAPGRKDELFDALRAEGYGDMITETVTPLSSFVKEQIAENGDELPAGCGPCECIRENDRRRAQGALNRPKESEDFSMNKNEMLPGTAIRRSRTSTAEAMNDELSGMDVSLDRVTIPAAGGTASELPGELPADQAAKESRRDSLSPPAVHLLPRALHRRQQRSGLRQL
ncbi:MAG: hypothetical protein ACLUI3_14920 [Christensenellales bacterium]